MRTVKFFRDHEKSFQFFSAFLKENFNLPNEEKTEEHFAEYCEIILSENKKYNLTSLSRGEEIFEILFLDSLLPFTFLKKFESGERVIDVGSGAGVPGLVLALVFPKTHFTLLDATRKKCKFVESLVERFGLENVDVRQQRAEEAGHEEDLRESFDFGLARSLAQLNILFEYVMPFLKEDGVCYAYKGRLTSLERTRGEGALMELAGTFEDEKEYVLPLTGKKRIIATARKTGKCPKKYPRRTGIPKKRPL